MDINLAQFSFSVALKDGYKTKNFDIDYPGLIMKIYLKRQVRDYTLHQYDSQLNLSIRLVTTWSRPIYLQAFLYFWPGCPSLSSQSPFLEGNFEFFFLISLLHLFQGVHEHDSSSHSHSNVQLCQAKCTKVLQLKMENILLFNNFL